MLRFWVLLLIATVAGAEAPKRKATIEWRSVDGAKEYELEVASAPEMEPKLLRKTYPGNSVRLTLPLGTYYFRVRGIGEDDAPGPWTDVQGFIVNPAPPQALSPAARAVVKEELKDGTLTLNWTPGLKGTTHHVEVTDAQGATSVWKTPKDELEWKPPGPGVYRWRVGHETPSGTQWGERSVFQVNASAIPGPAVEKVVEYVERQADGSVAPTEAAFIEDPKAVRKAEWSAIFRGAQSIVAYTANDVDSNVNASGAAVVGMLGAELRWRGPKSTHQRWTWSGALSFESLSQTVLGTQFNLPRLYGRVFYGREFGRWRFGGFAHLALGEAGIFIVQGSTEAVRTRVVRQGYGLGGMGTYRASDTLFLSTILMLRLDTGGESDDLPNALTDSLGIELGFGLSLNLSKKFFAEGRLRLLTEDYRWAAATAPDAQSSLSTAFVILDLGVGYRL
ncbi:MAG: hypothetical protein IT285_07965 [Bdellovibrionales bacterium]|nr:hypothetical protein [Bdellovibrionales bacterium]